MSIGHKLHWKAGTINTCQVVPWNDGMLELISHIFLIMKHEYFTHLRCVYVGCVCATCTGIEQISALFVKHPLWSQMNVSLCVFKIADILYFHLCNYNSSEWDIAITYSLDFVCAISHCLFFVFLFVLR